MNIPENLKEQLFSPLKTLVFFVGLSPWEAQQDATIREKMRFLMARYSSLAPKEALIATDYQAEWITQMRNQQLALAHEAIENARSDRLAFMFNGGHITDDMKCHAQALRKEVFKVNWEKAKEYAVNEGINKEEVIQAITEFLLNEDAKEFSALTANMFDEWDEIRSAEAMRETKKKQHDIKLNAQRARIEGMLIEQETARRKKREKAQHRMAEHHQHLKALKEAIRYRKQQTKQQADDCVQSPEQVDNADLSTWEVAYNEGFDNLSVGNDDAALSHYQHALTITETAHQKAWSLVAISDVLLASQRQTVTMLGALKVKITPFQQRVYDWVTSGKNKEQFPISEDEFKNKFFPATQLFVKNAHNLTQKTIEDAAIHLAQAINILTTLTSNREGNVYTVFEPDITLLSMVIDLKEKLEKIKVLVPELKAFTTFVMTKRRDFIHQKGVFGDASKPSQEAGVMKSIAALTSPESLSETIQEHLHLIQQKLQSREACAQHESAFTEEQEDIAVSSTDDIDYVSKKAPVGRPFFDKDVDIEEQEFTADQQEILRQVHSINQNRDNIFLFGSRALYDIYQQEKLDVPLPKDLDFFIEHSQFERVILSLKSTLPEHFRFADTYTDPDTQVKMVKVYASTEHQIKHMADFVALPPLYSLPVKPRKLSIGSWSIPAFSLEQIIAYDNLSL